MTGSSRADLLRRLNDLMELCPEMRFGQLIANLAVAARGTGQEAVWEMEDEELIAAVEWQLTELSTRRGDVSTVSSTG
jgi:hypothetical protein